MTREPLQDRLSKDREDACHGHSQQIGQDHAYREDHDRHEQDQERHERRAPLSRHASRWMGHDSPPLLSPTAPPPGFRHPEKCPGGTRVLRESLDIALTHSPWEIIAKNGEEGERTGGGVCHAASPLVVFEEHSGRRRAQPSSHQAIASCVYSQKKPPPRPFPSNAPPPSAMHFSCQTFPCPSAVPRVHLALIVSSPAS
jgi:hypothetical protein